METRIDIKKLALATVAVFAALSIFEYILHTFVLASTYAHPDIRRFWLWQEMDFSVLKWLCLGYFLFAGLFTFLYARGYQAKPALGQGARYGFYVGLLIHLPSLFIQHGLMMLPIVLIVAWSVAGLVECVLLGIVTSYIYRLPATA
jgi:hypothetical protein